MKADPWNRNPAGPLRDPPRSILIVMLSAVGDAVQALPVACALRRSFPSTHITWVLQAGPYSLVDGHPAVDEFVLFEGGQRGKSLRSLSSGIKGIRSAARALGRIARRQPGGRFDLLLDLQVYLKAGLLTASVPARIKMGFDWKRCRDLNWIFTDRRIPPHPTGAGHIQDQYFEFLEHLGVNPEPIEYGLRLSGEELASQSAFFSTLNRPVCALVLGSSDSRKNWTAEGYARVASEIRNKFRLQPVLVGSHSAAETEMAHAVLTQTGPWLMDQRGGGLRRLLWLLGGSSLVISPDTGPMHMARAMNVPVVSLFGFTNPKRSGPYRRFTNLIVDGYARFPGETYQLRNDRRPGGMDRITHEMVMEKVELALREEEV